MILRWLLRVFVISSWSISLSSSWNYSFGIEITDHDIQNIYIGIFYALANQKININEQRIIKFGYHVGQGYYALDPLLFSVKK